VNDDLFHSLSFGAPGWLWALAVLPLVIALFAWSERRRLQLLQRLVAARLQPTLAGSVSLARRRLHGALILGALACFAVAMAQPRYGYTVEEAKRKGRDVLVAVDTSRSMLANDVQPNRLARAKLAAQDFIDVLGGDRLGLIAFAGSAFLQAPLTVDYTAVFSSLNELDTNVIPLGGTNLAEAIRTAAEAFGKGESESRALVIFTDGEDLGGDALEAARKVAGTMRIFTVGIGSADGSLIPVPGEDGGTQFVKGPDGQFVKSRLDEKTLAGIAEATRGFYTRLQNGPADMRRIFEQGLGKLKESEIDVRFSHRPIERYQWPLGFGIALLAASLLLNDRRRKAVNGAGVLALLLVLTMALPQSANAASGEELYQQKRYDEALRQYEEALKRRPGLPALEFDKGATDYALGDLDAAAAAFGKALAATDPQLRSKVEQNLGTTLLKRALGRDETKEAKEREADLKNSVQHLEEALKLEKANRDAQTNLGIAQRELAKPKPTPPPSKKDQKQDDKKDDQKDNKDQQSKDQQSKDQQSKDQQSKDQQSKDQQSKDQQSKDQQSKDQQSKDQQSKGVPSPSTDEKKLSGEIKSGDSQSEPKKEGEEAEAEVPVQPGEMSPNQARAVLDSLKGEDEQPKHEQKSAVPVLKDW